MQAVVDDVLAGDRPERDIAGEAAEMRAEMTGPQSARAHLGRTQLLRSLEIALLTGRRLSDLHRESETPARARASRVWWWCSNLR